MQGTICVAASLTKPRIANSTVDNASNYIQSEEQCINAEWITSTSTAKVD